MTWLTFILLGLIIAVLLMSVWGDGKEEYHHKENNHVDQPKNR